MKKRTHGLKKKRENISKKIVKSVLRINVKDTMSVKHSDIRIKNKTKGH